MGPKAVIQGILDRYIAEHSHKMLKVDGPEHKIYAFLPDFFVATHEIPCHSFCTVNGDEEAGAAQDPEHGDRQLHTGRPLHRTTEIRRASEQTSPPGGARSWTPSDGTAADRVVAATRSAFSISSFGFGTFLQGRNGDGRGVQRRILPEGR